MGRRRPGRKFGNVFENSILFIAERKSDELIKVVGSIACLIHKFLTFLYYVNAMGTNLLSHSLAIFFTP